MVQCPQKRTFTMQMLPPWRRCEKAVQSLPQADSRRCSRPSEPFFSHRLYASLSTTGIIHSFGQREILKCTIYSFAISRRMF